MTKERNFAICRIAQPKDPHVTCVAENLTAHGVATHLPAATDELAAVLRRPESLVLIQSWVERNLSGGTIDYGDIDSIDIGSLLKGLARPRQRG